MILRDDLSAYLANFLEIDKYRDYAPNGLQVEGKGSISKICTAVTASMDIIKQAVDLKADALLVHHGYFWRGEPSAITGMKKRRIFHLLNAEMNLFAYHLPLDCHLSIGNNACLANLLGVESVNSHAIDNTPNLLWFGEMGQPLSQAQMETLISQKLKRQPMSISFSDKPIKRIAWCTGAAQDLIENAHALGADAYLSGEVSERTYYQTQELGLHYFACGHHASERYGIQALGQHLSEKFDLQYQFLDSLNPV